jgi:hypothetical protein
VADEKIRVQIESDYNDRDARKALRDVERLEDADVEIPIEADTEDVESNVEKAAQAIKDLADTADAELRDTKSAADALAQALGPELSAKMDPAEIVGDLRKIGLTCDEIRADADLLADALGYVDDVDMANVAAGAGGLKSKLGEVRGEADQSRSVLANMAGNAAQDFGELGGITGTLGVGIGQLAEYATEGNIALGNLAKVAGPMAGLAAATLLVQTHLSRVAKQKAFEADSVKAYADAVAELGPGVDAIEASMKEIVALDFQRAPEWNDFLAGTEDIPDVAAAFGVLGLNVTQVADAIAGDADAVAHYHDTIAETLGDETDLYDDWLTTQQDAYNQTTANAAGAERFWSSTRRSMLESLADERRGLADTDRAWRTLLTAQDESRLVTSDNVAVWNQLRQTLGLTEDEMAATFNQKWLDWQEEQIALLEEQQAELDAYAAAARNANGIMESADWGRANIDGATAAYEQFRQGVTGDRQRVADSEAAWDDLGEAIDTAGQHVTDLGSPEGRAVYAAIDDLGSTIVPDLAQAFDDAGGDINDFRRRADILRVNTLKRLTDELGGNEEAAAALIAELGLMPDQITTFYELAGDEAARVKLGLLQGVIDALPEDVQTEVAMHILADDPQAALAAVQRAINQAPDPTAQLQLDIQPALDALARFRDAIRGAQILAGALTATVSTATANVSASAAPATVITMHLPRGTRPDDAIRAADRYARRNGRTRATRR